MTQARVAAARGILRGLYALSRHVRLYGLTHPRSELHLRSAYAQTLSFLPTGGLSIVLAGDRLTVDAVSLEQTAAEQSFARFLRDSGREQFDFDTNFDPEALQSIVTAMAAKRVTHAKSAGQRWMAVATDDRRDWLVNATQLLHMMDTAASNSEETQAGEHARLAQHAAEDMGRVLNVVSKWGKSDDEETVLAAARELDRMPRPLWNLVHEIVTELASEENQLGYDALLLRVGEQVVIRFVLTKLESGALGAADIPSLLERLVRQLMTLRTILPGYEETAARSAAALESMLESLEQDLWNTAPDTAKRMVLLFDSPFYVPARCIETYVERLIAHGEESVAALILKNYGAAVDGRDAEGRRRTAKGLGEIAELYALVVPEYVPRLVKSVSRQLMRESDLRMQSWLSAALIRLSYAVQQQRDFVATAATSDAMDEIAHRRPALGMELRPRVSVESRLQEYMDEALSARRPSDEMVDLLRRHAVAATQQLCLRSLHCNLREESARLTNLAEQLGSEAREEMLRRLRTGTSDEALSAVGLLISLEPEETTAVVARRASEWIRDQQDILVRQLAIAASPMRGEALLRILPQLDPLLVPGAIDEIGMSGAQRSGDALMEIAMSAGTKRFTAYSKLKAIEAVGRLQARSTMNALKEFLRQRKLMKWTHPRESRIAALQALMMMDPEQGVRVMATSGIAKRELALGPLAADPENPWARQRKYARISPRKPMRALATSQQGDAGLDITTLSLGGGRAMREGRLQPGADMLLQLQSASRKMKSRVLVREVVGNEFTFEIADIGMGDRSKLRQILLAQRQSPMSPMAAA